jgi:hypothetical protein
MPELVETPISARSSRNVQPNHNSLILRTVTENVVRTLTHAGGYPHEERRPEDRRRDRAQGAVLSGPPDRDQCGRRRLRHRRQILEKDQYAYGFDSQTGEYGNLVTKGIIDPTKVVRAAIQNAERFSMTVNITNEIVSLDSHGESSSLPKGGRRGILHR